MRPVNKRKRTTPVWKHPAFRPLALSAALGIMAALITYAVQTGLADMASNKAGHGFMSASAKSGFIIRDVFVEGRDNTPLEDLRDVVNLDLDAPILDVKPAYLQKRIEALPWVAQATVERRLPDIIHIRLLEHRPVAMWQNEGRFSLINKDGEIILTGGDDINVFAHLPLVVGKGAAPYAEKILSILASEPALNARVKAAVRVSERRWDIVMKDGSSIRLPEDHPAQAWARLAVYDREHELFEKKLASVDMRLKDRILVKIDNPERIRKPLMGQDT